jgi:membrane-associated phospholipid phosphatase
MVKLIKSITQSIGHGVKNDPEVQRIKLKYPKIFNFIKKRLTPNEKFGLYLTIGSIITLTFIYFFFKIVRDYIGQESIIRSDYRLLSIFKMFRTPLINNVVLFITYLGKGEIIIFSLIIVSIILILLKQRFYFFSLITSVLGGELFVSIIKNTIDRPRPSLADTLVIENSWSFPSGHTFTAISFYGLLTFFIAHNLKKKWQRIITYTIGLFLIILIGLSRIFLGAHWPSDVLASFFSGIAWLSILVTIASIKKI